jgi:YaiO family outer membrane protein
MTRAKLLCGAALLALTTAAAAAGSQAGETGRLPGSSRPLAFGGADSSVRIEYTDFSKLYGDRVVATAETRLRADRATRVTVGLSEGQRSAGGTRTRATLGAVAVDHDWSGRLSTHTAASAATNGAVFAKWLIGQDISYKLAPGLVATAGGRYADYGHGNGVATWSAGAAYYMRGASISYRYSLLASTHFGRSGYHLASLRLADPAGRGATQLWVAHGTSLYEVNLPNTPNGRFTSIAVLRSQPVRGGVALNLGVNQAWYKTPAGSYTGTGVVAGLSFSNWPF